MVWKVLYNDIKNYLTLSTFAFVYVNRKQPYHFHSVKMENNTLKNLSFKSPKYILTLENTT